MGAPSASHAEPAQGHALPPPPARRACTAMSSGTVHQERTAGSNRPQTRCDGHPVCPRVGSVNDHAACPCRWAPCHLTPRLPCGSRCSRQATGLDPSLPSLAAQEPPAPRQAIVGTCTDQWPCCTNRSCDTCLSRLHIQGNAGLSLAPLGGVPCGAGLRAAAEQGCGRLTAALPGPHELGGDPLESGVALASHAWHAISSKNTSKPQRPCLP